MKKIIMLLMLLVSLATANAKCDWSSLKLQQWNERNYYKWYVSGKVLDDTCVDWMFMVYDFQTKKTDTIRDNKGLVEVQFNVDCKKYTFEMTTIKGYPLKDTCMSYYLMFYSGPWMAKMSQSEWDSLSDYQIGMEYDFPDADFLGYNQTRISDFEFKDTGRVLVIAQWWNKCLKQDTFMFRKLDVCKRSNVSDVITFDRPEPKVIGMYDMMGRPVHNVRKEDIVIYLYDNGTTKKVLIH